jgi:hypothetical protein
MRSAAALAQVGRDVMTGEGPTVCGRVHFSRTIDAKDAALCAQLLLAAGRTGQPVSRAEADALFDIHAVARERRDDGRFADLLVKAVVHHVMAQSGVDMPPREFALAAATPLDAWASAVEIDPESGSWLQARLGQMRPGDSAASAIAKVLFGTEPASQNTVAALFDRAA